MEDFETARDSFAQALPIYEARLPPEHPSIALCTTALTATAHAVEDYDRVLELMPALEQLRDRVEPEERIAIGAAVSDALVARGRAAEAVEWARFGVTNATGELTSALSRFDATIALARARAAAGEDPAAAIADAEQARRELKAATDVEPDKVQERLDAADEWQAKMRR
jgi:hypothetical protein